MRIIVCFKEVTDSPVGLNGSPRRTPPGVIVKINPQDLVALEQALSLQEGQGAEVVALCYGRDERAPRRALTLGANRAILVEDSQDGPKDWLTTSLVLARAASRIGFDLVLCGTQLQDSMDGAVGPGIAEHLGIPVVTHAVKLEPGGVDDRTLTVTSGLPKGIRDTYRVDMPCVVTVTESLNQPRYVPLWGKTYRRGLQRPVERITIPELDIPSEDLVPRTIDLGVGELKPRIRVGVKVTGMSIQDKLRLLKAGVPKNSEKRRLVIREPERAASELLQNLTAWLEK